MKTKSLFTVALLMVYANSITSCKKKETPTPAATYTIGKSYGGGIIFYVDGSGQHGLIAAITDQSTGMQWYNGTNILTNAAGTALGTGQINTTAIVNAQGSGSYAANICDQLVLNGYSDWFLPSKDELKLLYLQKSVVGGFSNNLYWSSSENSSGVAWYQKFLDGYQDYEVTNYTNYVRAIRAF